MILLDSKGVINQHRQDLQHNKWKMAFINHCDFTSLNEIIIDADIFIGLSVANVLTADMVSKMHEQPIILALANPEPEITPAEALKGNPSAIIGTGSSKYYNQVNNMLTLPYLLRLALKLSLQSWSQEIFIKTAQAIADLAKSQDNFDNKHLVPQLLHPDLLEHILNVYID